MNSFTKFVFNEVHIGWIGTMDPLTIFFGNKNAHVETLARAFPSYRFQFLQQVHGNFVVRLHESTTFPFLPQADAAVSSLSNLALTIQTADCLPILLSFDSGRVIGAAHAGWRGLEQRVTQEVLNAMVERCKPPDGEHDDVEIVSKLKVFIGPHIQFQSFEVGQDVADRLAKSLKSIEPSQFFQSHPHPEKKCVDLSGIAKAQFSELGIPESNIWTSDQNTFTDPDLVSYRRQGHGCGRLLSFVVYQRI